MEFLKRQGWVILLLVMLCPGWAHATDTLKLGEQQIKAGLLYNFIKYTKWPESDDAAVVPITVCTFGDDPFNGALQPMQRRTVNQRAITLRAVRDVASVDGCHLLFINGKEKSAWPGIRSFVAGKPIMTVSDFEGFAEVGGMIEFGYEKQHIIAVLNIDATNSAGLKVEERLLKLVTIVRGARQ